MTICRQLLAVFGWFHEMWYRGKGLVWSSDGLSTANSTARQPTPNPPPRMVTCELSRVCCWLARCQHNRQHMQFTRVKGKLVKSQKAAPGAFRKKVCEMQCE